MASFIPVVKIKTKRKELKACVNSEYESISEQKKKSTKKHTFTLRDGRHYSEE